jgi:hypothetical protein
MSQVKQKTHLALAPVNRSGSIFFIATKAASGDTHARAHTEGWMYRAGENDKAIITAACTRQGTHGRKLSRPTVASKSMSKRSLTAWTSCPLISVQRVTSCGVPSPSIWNLSFRFASNDSLVGDDDAEVGDEEGGVCGSAQLTMTSCSPANRAHNIMGQTRTRATSTHEQRTRRSKERELGGRLSEKRHVCAEVAQVLEYWWPHTAATEY